MESDKYACKLWNWRRKYELVCSVYVKRNWSMCHFGSCSNIARSVYQRLRMNSMKSVEDTFIYEIAEVQYMALVMIVPAIYLIAGFICNAGNKK